MALHSSDKSQGAAALDRHGLKITLKQSQNGAMEPMLTVMVTGSVRYMKDKALCSTVEETMSKIEKWLRSKTNVSADQSPK